MQQLVTEEKNVHQDIVANANERVGDGTSMGRVCVTLENCTVHAGTLLKGYVNVLSPKSDVEEVTLKVEGVGSVRLDADNGKTYSANEVYLRDRMTLWSQSQSHQPTKGSDLKVPFEYFIPKDVESSFDGHYAKVVYTCTGIVKYVGPFSRKQNDKRKFFVLPSLDRSLADMESADDLRKMNKRKKLSSFGIVDGTVEVQMEADKIFVRRSESVGLTVSVKNDSALYLRSLKFGLLQIVSSGAKGRQIIEKNPIVVYDENIVLKPKEMWQGRRMCSIDESLQPTVETSKGNKIACSVSYLLFVTVVPPNFARSCELSFPLNVY